MKILRKKEFNRSMELCIEVVFHSKIGSIWVKIGTRMDALTSDLCVSSDFLRLLFWSRTLVLEVARLFSFHLGHVPISFFCRRLVGLRFRFLLLSGSPRIHTVLFGHPRP